MSEWLKLLAYALRALFKSRARLEAENLVLREQLDGEIRDLVRRMSLANPLWSAPRVHGELVMLGIEIAQSTVAKYMVPSLRSTAVDSGLIDSVADGILVAHTDSRPVAVLVVRGYRKLDPNVLMMQSAE